MNLVGRNTQDHIRLYMKYLTSLRYHRSAQQDIVSDVHACSNAQQGKYAAKIVFCLLNARPQQCNILAKRWSVRLSLYSFLLGNIKQLDLSLRSRPNLVVSHIRIVF